MAGDDDDVRDALQQSWIIVLEKLHQYRGESPACGWVGSIVRHEALHAAAARGRDVSLSPPATAREVRPRSGRSRPDPSGTLPKPRRIPASLSRLLLEVIDELPPTFREVVRLRDVEDRPTDEVARRLHISARNVRVRRHRAHQLLRPRLLRRLSAPPSALRRDLSRKNL